MIHLSRQAEEGDLVVFVVLRDLMVREGIGEVIQTTPYGARIKARCSQFWNGDTEIDVPIKDAIPVLDESEVIKYLVEQLKLISVQDQGLGGTVTPDDCWRSSQRIALDTLTKFKDLKS